jgi:hypothetical protein
MRPVLRRIAIHGGLTALLLGLVGFVFAELASIWLASSPGTRAATGEPVVVGEDDGGVAAALRARVPLLMAVWGFVFITLGELALYLWRGESPRPAAAAPTPEADAEQLLEELLTKAEASRQESGVESQESDKQPATP